ncbi:hypothetical protein MMC31_007598 [Peltigera leucophlebia]|nr:hypothetical protein [Peltigera leucophlebia]
MAMRAMKEFMVAVYGSQYTEEGLDPHLKKARKEWARRRRKGTRWLTLVDHFGTGVFLLPIFAFEFPHHRLADLSDEAMKKALEGWSRNTDFRAAVNFLLSKAITKQRMTPIVGILRGGHNIKAVTSSKEDPLLIPDEEE